MSKGKHRGTDDDDGRQVEHLTNAKIVETVIAMVNQIGFIRDEARDAVRIIGEFIDDVFDPNIIDTVFLRDIPRTVDSYLVMAERLLRDTSKYQDGEVVRSLYMLMKAEALINVKP